MFPHNLPFIQSIIPHLNIIFILLHSSVDLKAEKGVPPIFPSCCFSVLINLATPLGKKTHAYTMKISMYFFPQGTISFWGLQSDQENLCREAFQTVPKRMHRCSSSLCPTCPGLSWTITETKYQTIRISVWPLIDLHYFIVTELKLCGANELAITSLHTDHF